MKNVSFLISIILILYGYIAGMMVEIPQTIIGDSMRIMFYHVSMWFAMIVLLTLSMYNSIKYLQTYNLDFDLKAVSAARVGLVFGIIGITTGMIWAKTAWGYFWTNDPKLNGAALSLLAYFSYFILRQNGGDLNKRAKLSASYNILAFVMTLLFIGIYPRLNASSIHPGSLTGNPALNPSDLSSHMRWVFYPTALGWIIFSYHIYQLTYKIFKNE